MMSNGISSGATVSLRVAVTRRERNEVIADVILSSSTPHSSTEEQEPPIDRLVAKVIGKQEEPWKVLLGRLDLLVQLGDELTEVSTGSCLDYR